MSSIVTRDGSGSLAEIDALHARYPELPVEALVKEDLLRQGVWFSAEALAVHREYAEKSYFIFSFDHRPLAEMEGAERDAAPEEISLTGGTWGFRRVIVSVRLNPSSSWKVDAVDGRAVLRCDGGEPIADVGFAPKPPYYGQLTNDGTPVIEVAPTIEWGYLLYLTVFRLCQYFGRDEECRFCDINENFRQQKASGRPYFPVKPVERVLDALRRVVASGAQARAYTLTGGSITSELDGLDEASFYVRYAEAIEAEFPGRWIGKMVVQALPLESVRRIHASGIRIYHPNYEIWDAEKFKLICPGKERYVGRDTWIRRILDSVDVFGRGKVIPNFVGGVEMSKPFGFSRIEDALKSTGEGLDYMMSRGVIPRFTTWCPEPLSELGATNPPAPLAYHAGLLDLYKAALERHGLAAPPGYGDPGIGNAVFSVSAFMDVLDAKRGSVPL